MSKSKARINHAVFSRRALDSSALMVLASLVHPFAAAGSYTIQIRSGTRGMRQLFLEVVKSGAPRQLTVDLADTPKTTSQDCCHEPDADVLKVLQGGFVVFHVSHGFTAYTLQIVRTGKDPVVVLDSEQGVPAGDAYCTALAIPGQYTANDLMNAHDLPIRVERPDRDNPAQRHDRPVVVEVAKCGFSVKELRIYTGQTIVFVCKDAARLRVVLSAVTASEAPTTKPRFMSRRRTG